MLWTISVRRMSTASSQSGAKALIVPYVTARNAERRAAAVPMKTEMRPPCQMQAKMSRPRGSVPKTCSGPGGWSYRARSI